MTPAQPRPVPGDLGLPEQALVTWGLTPGLGSKSAPHPLLRAGSRPGVSIGEGCGGQWAGCMSGALQAVASAGWMSGRGGRPGVLAGAEWGSCRQWPCPRSLAFPAAGR
jgi:hypothetical protein